MKPEREPRAAPCEEQTLDAVGGTVRGQRTGVYAVLVVGDTLSSHFWLNLLPLARDPQVRHFVTVDDLALVAGRLHVLPDLVPSFLVFYHGFPVDWFPAPLPPAREAGDPAALVRTVRRRLADYAQ